MKPIFGTDITTDKKNSVSNAESFVCDRISQSTQASLDKVSEEAMTIEKKMSLPTPLRIFQVVDGIVLCIFLRVILNVLTDEEVTFSQALHNAPWMFIVFGVSLLAFVLMTLYGNKLRKDVGESDEHATVSNRVDVVCQNINSELGVPESAVDVDVLSFAYKEKKGEFVATEQGISPIKFINFSYKVYEQEGNLYLSDLECKYCIPLDKKKNIVKINKRITIPMWNKEQAYNKGEYKQYKISSDNDMYSFKPYYVLNVEHNGELWGIYFPSYELPVIEELTGLKAE